MKIFNNTIIIGIDHGYGNMKTASCCFPTGLIAYNSEPLFTKELLVYNGKYYLIGEEHKEYISDKSLDEDFYVLTLAAIAKELSTESITEANIYIAAGLPLTWTSGQKADFSAYLMRNKEVSFTFHKQEYHLHIEGVSIYPQGYAAIAPYASKLTGVNVIADIGNGTMNVLYMVNGKPQSGKMFTEKFGTYQCTLAVREAFMQQTQRELNDHIIEEVLRTGKADIPKSDLAIVKAVAAEYVNGIFRRLREHGYDENTMRLWVTGGGGCLIKNFGKVNSKRITFEEDICAAAKGYEEFTAVKRSYAKTGGIEAYHGYLSFKEQDITPELSLKIGTEFAQEVWGKRFQVLVTVHTDTEHPHCHFVINSVSFVDGKRLWGEEKVWFKFKKTADRLCEKYGLYYNPKPVRGRSSSYHYNREKKGEPTRYLLAREAMGKALSQCTNTADLRYTLAKLGYELTMNDRRKYWTITPKGCKKPIRLVKLSVDYTPEGIRRRLVNNRYDRPPRIDYRHYRPKQYKLSTCGDRILQRTSGIYRIYLYYAFRLGVIHSYRRPDPAKLHWIFKEELAYLDRLSEEVRMMGREKITTDVELLAYKQKLKERIQTFTDERADLRKHSRRKISADERSETKDKISHITINLRKLRHELKLCEHIAERSKVMEQGLESVLNDERKARAKNKSRGYER